MGQTILSPYREQDNIVWLLRTTRHIATKRLHICSECFSPIEEGERYYCKVYASRGHVAQYKTHVECGG